MKRCISLLLVLVICISLVVPAQATGLDDSFVDLLALAEESSFLYFPAATTYTAHLSLPSNLYRYIECVFHSDVAPSSVGVFVNDLPLNVVYIGNNLYRAYGTFNVPANFIELVFNFGAVCNTLNLISCKASTMYHDTYPISGNWSGYAGSSYMSGSFDGINGSIIYQEVTGGGSYVNYTYDYNIGLFPGINGKWKAYDKIALAFTFNGYAINSITAELDGVNILESISYIENGAYTDLRYNINGQYFFESSNDFRYVTLILDVSNLQKMIDVDPVVTITGSYEPSTTGNEALFTVLECNGIVIEEFDVQSSWLKRIFTELKNGFNNLLINFTTWFNLINNNIAEGFHNVLAKLDQFFNDDSAELDAAVQTQEEVNVSINNQLVGAVEDWNSNIEVVETGYGLAVTQATPALMWLSSLATRIFNNMGWFANIYFLVGLFSVFMLILSKSGLARSIRRNR